MPESSLVNEHRIRMARYLKRASAEHGAPIWKRVSEYALKQSSSRRTINVKGLGSRTKEGDVVRDSLRADLTPSGRQIDVTAEWSQPLAVGELRIGAAVTHQPRHRAHAAPEFLVRGGWRWQY